MSSYRIWSIVAVLAAASAFVAAESAAAQPSDRRAQAAPPIPAALRAALAKGAPPQGVVNAVKSLRSTKAKQRTLAGYYGLPMVVDGVPQCLVLGNLAGIQTNLVYAYPFNTTTYNDWQYVWVRPYVWANNQYYGGYWDAGGWINEANGSSAARGSPEDFNPIPLAWYHQYIAVVYVVAWYDYYTGQYYYDADARWGACSYL